MATNESKGRSGARYPRGAGWLPIAPKQLPGFPMMFDDIGASPARLARHLGCDRTTIYRWLDGEPLERRAYALALFYETRWGREFVALEVENDARLYGGAMLCQARELARLRALTTHLGAIGEFGSCSNDPALDILATPRHELQLVAARAISQETREAA